LASSGEAAGFVFVTERMRLFSAPHPQLSVIPLLYRREGFLLMKQRDWQIKRRNSVCNLD